MLKKNKGKAPTIERSLREPFRFAYSFVNGFSFSSLSFSKHKPIYYSFAGLLTVETNIGIYSGDKTTIT